jgi:hypothetical protein
MVAADSTLHSIKKTFEKEGVPTPGGQKLWLAPSMRRTILNDVYRPYDHDALEELVSRGHLSPQVLANLDATNNYGVWWYGVNRVELTPMGDHRRRWSKNPESERVAVPVPDAGIPRETVDAARDALKRSFRPRKESKHFYEVRGMLRCTCCGLLMTGYSTGSGYRYYQCQSRKKHGKDDYPNGATRRADNIERDVMCYVQVLISDREKLRAQIDEAIAREMAGLRDPDADCAALEQQVEKVFKLRSAYQDQQAAGLMTLEELSQKLRQLEDQRVAAEDNLAELRRGQSKIEHLRAKKRALLEAYGNGMLLGIDLFTPSMRRAIYEMLQLNIFVSSTGMRVQSVVDANVVRMTREVEDYAARYLEVQVKGLPYEGDSFVDAWQAAVSPKRTDKVMAEVVS